MEKQNTVPEFIRVEVAAFVRSDSTESGAKIIVGGRCKLSALDSIAFDQFGEVACMTLNEALGVTDARTMTHDEVEAYLAPRTSAAARFRWRADGDIVEKFDGNAN